MQHLVESVSGADDTLSVVLSIKSKTKYPCIVPKDKQYTIKTLVKSTQKFQADLFYSFNVDISAVGDSKV